MEAKSEAGGEAGKRPQTQWRGKKEDERRRRRFGRMDEGEERKAGTEEEGE